MLALWRSSDLYHFPPFFTELSNEDAFRAVYPQRNFGAIIGQCFERRKCRNRNQSGETGQQNGEKTQRGESSEKVNPPTR